MHVCTYNLGFFFGPGLPLSLGRTFGSIAGGARLRPVTVPPPLLLLLSDFGGASELGSGSSLPFDGSGVALDSDDLSADSGGWTDGDGSGLMDADEVGFTSDGNCASRSGDRRSVTILLFLADFDVDLVVVLVDDIVGDGEVDGLCVGVVVVDCRDDHLAASSACAREGLITCSRSKPSSEHPYLFGPCMPQFDCCLYFAHHVIRVVELVWYSGTIFRVEDWIV